MHCSRPRQLLASVWTVSQAVSGITAGAESEIGVIQLDV
jgi:hypothetical protein